MIGRDQVDLHTEYGDIKLEGDAAEKAMWVAELASARREQWSGKRSVEQPTGLLREAAMSREFPALVRGSSRIRVG